jgi:hypothetical protein
LTLDRAGGKTPQQESEGATVKACLAAIACFYIAAAGASESLQIPFAVQADQPGVELGACRDAPSFVDNAANDAVMERIGALIGEDQALTLASSSAGRVLERKGTEIEGLWPAPSSEEWASCTSRCIKLPPGARLTLLRFFEEDGTTVCLHKPIVADEMPELAGLNCGNSAWLDIVVTRVEPDRTMICATATSWHVVRPKSRWDKQPQRTANKLLADYE